MGRLARIVLNTATAVSLVACVATAALWARSYRALDTVTFQLRHGRLLWCDSFVGRLTLTVEDGWPYTLRWGRPGSQSTPIEETANARLNFWPVWRRFGFDYERERIDHQEGDVVYPGRGLQARYSIPFWFLFIVTVARPAWLGVTWSRTRRARRIGRCPACNYDLRATPDRCPECGAATMPPRSPELR